MNDQNAIFGHENWRISLELKAQSQSKAWKHKISK